MSDKSLYRDPVNGKITGVCAGIANYFGVEIWLVRILAVSAALFGAAFLVILAYVAFTLMLEKQPLEYREQVKSNKEHKIKSKAWQAGQTPERLLANLANDLDRLEQRTRKLEAYVTSDTFSTHRAFDKL